MKNLNRSVLAAMLLVLAGSPVIAHHSFSMFDRTKVQRLSGTVKRFEWTQPHCYFIITVSGADGAKDWLVETGGPGTLVRQDPRWNKDVVKAGDKVTVAINPLKNGDSGGDLYDLWTPGGLRIGPHAPNVQ